MGAKMEAAINCWDKGLVFYGLEVRHIDNCLGGSTPFLHPPLATRT